MAERYTHPDQTSPMRPDIGTQPQFRKKKPPKTYRYDSSLPPSLEWDGQHGARDLGEWLLELIERGSTLEKGAFDAPQEFRTADGATLLAIRTGAEGVHHLKCLSKPFPNWTGKAERCRLTSPRRAAAVNADGKFGKWEYAMARSLPRVREMLDSL